MKILVGIPCMEHVPVDFANSIAHLKNGGHQMEPHYEALSLVYVARERIAEIAIKCNYDYVLFIDSDMVFTPDLLINLLAADKDIVSGLAFMRKPPYNPCLYKKMRIGATGEKQEELLEDFDAGLVQIEGCGLACCLIKTEVLKAIKKHSSSIFWPYFGYGEDLTFCIKARKENFEIWADTRIKVGHISQFIVLEDAYRDWKEGAAQ